MVWRLLRDGEHAAAWNMALDQAILDAVEAGLAPATLRLYGWTEAAVSVGRFQDAGRDLDMLFCESEEIPVVRRPTGGRGILHGTDITVSLTTRTDPLGLRGSSVAAAYGRLVEGFIAAFRELGLPVTQGRCERRAERSGDCFQIRSVADLVTPDGGKLLGGALRRTSSSLLFQASIRYRRPDVAPARVFRGPIEDAHYPLEHLDEDEIQDAIVAGFTEALAVQVVPGAVTGWEEERAAALVKGLEIPAGEAGKSAVSGSI
jgi:lipoate-protein ligase A